MTSGSRAREWARVALRAIGRLMVLSLALPAIAFVGVGLFAPEFHLDRYEYSLTEGFEPAMPPPGERDRPGVTELTGFYGRFVVGVLRGNPGRSREAADRPLTRLLLQRARPSLSVLVVATTVAMLFTAAGVAIGARARPRSRAARIARWPGGALVGLLEGLPLPFVAMVAFVLVVRLAPRDGWAESDPAMVLWAGLALALGDAMVTTLWNEAGDETRRGLGRPYVLAARLRGEPPLAAVLPNLLPVLGARLRGTLLLFLGGLVVVEPALGINGLGETFKDIVTDRGGTDVLLFAGVLLLFALPVALADLVTTVLDAGGTEGVP